MPQVRLLLDVVDPAANHSNAVATEASAGRWHAFAFNVGANLHTEILYGRDSHHMAEALFKGLGRAIDQASQIDPRVTGVPSTKDAL